MKSEPTPTGGPLPSTKEHCVTNSRLAWNNYQVSIFNSSMGGSCGPAASACLAYTKPKAPSPHHTAQVEWYSPVI